MLAPSPAPSAVSVHGAPLPAHSLCCRMSLGFCVASSSLAVVSSGTCSLPGTVCTGLECLVLFILTYHKLTPVLPAWLLLPLNSWLRDALQPRIGLTVLWSMTLCSPLCDLQCHRGDKQVWRSVVTGPARGMKSLRLCASKNETAQQFFSLLHCDPVRIQTHCHFGCAALGWHIPLQTPHVLPLCRQV